MRLALAAVATLAVGAACRREPSPSSSAGAREQDPPGEEAPASTWQAATAGSASRAPPEPIAGDSDEARGMRLRLVAKLSREGYVRSERVTDAMRRVPRHLFVPGASLEAAYANMPVPIGDGQTISQPAVVGTMTQALELGGGERVLEIGTGSGYQAAVLAVLSARVFTIEIVPRLGDTARERLARLGYANVEVRVGDGYRGWPEQAPFDRILLTAAPPEVPQALVDQLAEGGILVAPVGPEGTTQRLLRVRKERGRITREDLGLVMFVPMVRGR